jgi:hypothetical protein
LTRRYRFSTHGTALIETALGTGSKAPHIVGEPRAKQTWRREGVIEGRLRAIRYPSVIHQTRLAFATPYVTPAKSLSDFAGLGFCAHCGRTSHTQGTSAIALQSPRSRIHITSLSCPHRWLVIASSGGDAPAREAARGMMNAHRRLQYRRSLAGANRMRAREGCIQATPAVGARPRI